MSLTDLPFDRCPYCGSKLVQAREAAIYRCESKDCAWWIFERDLVEMEETDG